MINQHQPTKNEVEFITFYDLEEFGYDFTQSEHQEDNWEILISIALDFANKFGIAPIITREAFDVERLYIRSTENILIMYNEIGTEDIFRFYTNKNTSIFKTFFR